MPRENDANANADINNNVPQNNVPAPEAPEVMKWKKTVDTQLGYLKNNQTVYNYGGPKLNAESAVDQSRLNSIDIPEDKEKGLTADIITLVTIGAYLDKNYAERTKGDGDVFDVRFYLFSNILGQKNPREKKHQMALYPSRLEAKKAIEEYKEGNKQNVERYLENVAKYIGDHAINQDIESNNANHVNNGFVDLVNKVKDEKIFENAKKSMPDDVQKKMNERAILSDKINQAFMAEKQLSENLPAVDSDERKELIKKVMVAGIMTDFFGKVADNFQNAFSVYDAVKEITTNKFFDENFSSFLAEKNVNDPDVLRREWGSRGQIVNYIAFQKVKFKYNSYQTEMLSDDAKQGQYYEQLDQIIEASDVYNDLMKETDPARFAKNIEKAKKCKFNVEQAEVDGFTSINHPYDYSLISDESENAIKTKLGYHNRMQVIDSIRESAKNEGKISINGKIVDDKKTEAQKKGMAVGQAVEKYIRENGLQVDPVRAYSEGGKPRLRDISAAAGDSVDLNSPLYVKNKNDGFEKFIINIEGDRIEIEHEHVKAIPYNPNNYIKDSDNNIVSAEILRSEAEKQPVQLLEARSKLLLYGQSMIDSYDDEDKTAKNEEYSQFLDALKDLYNIIGSAYKEENGKTIFKPENKEAYDSLKEEYKNVAVLCDKYLETNPYDLCAKEVNNFINRDLNLLNQVDLSKEDISVEDQLKIAVELVVKQEKPVEEAGGIYDEAWANSIDGKNLRSESLVKEYAGPVADPRNGFLGGERLKEVVIGTDTARGISEDVIQAITMGGYFSEDGVLKHKDPEWKMSPRSYLLDGMYNDMVTKHQEVFMPMFEVRQKVNTGFENYKNGDRTIVDSYAKSFVDFVKDELLTRDPSLEPAGNINYSLVKLVNRVAETDAFKNNPFPEEVLEKTKELEELGRLKRQAYYAEIDLATSLPLNNTEQRREKLLSLLIPTVVEQMPGKFNKPLNDVLTNLPQLVPENKSSGSLYSEEAVDKALERMKKVLPADNPRLNDNKKTVKENWEAAIKSQLDYTIAENNISATTYQTKMLADSEKKERYYKRISDMITSSKLFDDLMESKDPKQVKELIDLVKSDISNIKVKNYELKDGKVKITEKEFDINDIPEKEEEKKLLTDILAKEGARIPDRISEVEKRALDSVEDGCHRYVSESKNNVYGKLIDEKIKNLKLNLDKTVFFVCNSEAGQSLDEAIGFAEKNKQTLYIKDNEGGLYGFNLEKDENGKAFVVEQPGAKAIPYKSLDYITENRNFQSNNAFARLGVKADKPEYSVTYRCLDSYVKVMEAAAENADKSPEYSRMLDNLKTLNNKLTTVYDRYQKGNALLSGEEYADLHKTYTACEKALNNYWKKNPYDNCAKTVTRMIDSDLKILDHRIGDPEKKVIPENVNFVNAVLENKKDIVKEHIKVKAVEEHNYLLSSKKALAGKTGIQAVNSEMADSAIRQFFIENNKDKLVLDSKGKYIKNDKGEYLQTDGKYCTRKEQAEYLSAHREDLNKYIKDNFISYRDIHKDNEINPDAMSKFLKDKGVEGVIEDPVARDTRKERSISLEKSYREFLTKKELEKIISVEQNGGKLEREQYNFLKLDGSIKSREYNRKLSENMASGEPAKVKEAYEMILDSLMENNLKEFDINDNSNNSLLYKDPEKVFKMQTQLAETQAILDKAKQAGVNFADPKYKELIDKSGVSESLAFLWGRRINMELSPANDYFDYRKSDKMPYEKIENIAQEANSISEGTKVFEWDEPGAKPSFDLIAVGLKNMEQFYADIKINQKNWALKGRDKSFEQKLDAAQKILSKSTKIAPEDEKLVEFRNRLVNHKISSLIGKKHKDSELYKNIVKAIDAYRAAPDGDKETKRGELLDACGKYVSNRRSGAERTKMVRELGKFVFGEMEVYSREHDNAARKHVAEKLKDVYIDNLNKLKELPQHKEAIENILAGLNEAGQRVIVNKLMETDQCKHLAKDPDILMKYNNDKHILTYLSNEALTQVTQKNEELSTLVVDQNKLQLNAPINQGPNNI